MPGRLARRRQPREQDGGELRCRRSERLVTLRARAEHRAIQAVQHLAVCALPRVSRARATSRFNLLFFLKMDRELYL